MEAVRAVGIVRVPVIRACDDGGAPPFAGGSERFAGTGVVGERAIARRAEDDDGPRVAAEERERDRRAPVDRHLRLGGVVAAEADAGGRETRRAELLQNAGGELAVHAA